MAFVITLSEIFHEMSLFGENKHSKILYNADLGNAIIKNLNESLENKTLDIFCQDYEKLVKNWSSFKKPGDPKFINFVEMAKIRIFGGCFDHRSITQDDWIFVGRPDFKDELKVLYDCAKGSLKERYIMSMSLSQLKSEWQLVQCQMDRLEKEIVRREGNECYLIIGDGKSGPHVREDIEEMIKRERKIIEKRLSSYVTASTIEEMIEIEKRNANRYISKRYIEIYKKKYGPYLYSEIEEMVLDKICIIPLASLVSDTQFSYESASSADDVCYLLSDDSSFSDDDAPIVPRGASGKPKCTQKTTE